MRQNAIAWLTGQVTNARHAVILTHNIDFLFVQSVLQPRLRQAGNPRLTIFADAMCAAQTFDAQKGLLDGLGVQYRVVPVELGSGRRFHPKALFLTGPDRAALAIGSGNLTHGGMAANHEAWAFGVSDGDGAGLISGFRDYLQDLISTLPLAEGLRDGADVLFDPSLTWVENLPAPGGLVASPTATSILSQLEEIVGPEVRGVSLLAPYYDEKAAALTRLSERFKAPVTCWMQPGRAGLAKAVGEALPLGIVLKSVDCVEERRPSFVHAKVYAFYRNNDVVLAVGSANCSQAALLANRSDGWGNAELVAVETLTQEAVEAFFAELAWSEEAPTLPKEHPSEDWEVREEPRLQILAARYEDGRLAVAFASREQVAEVTVEAESGAWPGEGIAPNVVSCLIRTRPRLIRLSARTAEGQRVESAEAWVDDESSLAASATLRRVLRKLQESEDDGGDRHQTFRGVLELFRDYLCDPEASRRRLKRGEEAARQSGAYDPGAVFSDSFGAAGQKGLGIEGNDMEAHASVLSIVEALFRSGPSVKRPKVDAGENGKGGLEEEEPDAIAETLLQRTKASHNERTAGQLRRALKGVDHALRDPTFVQARDPSLLGADLALAAILLVKGVSEKLLDEDSFRETTRALWTALFFGDKGPADGSIPKRIRGIQDEAQRDAFIAALATPRLAAALALWGVTEWAAGDAEALWFRFSAAQLQERCPWLLAAGSPEIVGDEIDLLAASLLPPNEQVIARRTWVDVVRAGAALTLLQSRLSVWAATTSRPVSAKLVEPSDLVWANGRLGFPIARFRRDGGKAMVRFLGAAEPKPYVATFVFPVEEVVRAAGTELPEKARDHLVWLLDAAKNLGSRL